MAFDEIFLHLACHKIGKKNPKSLFTETMRERKKS